MKGILGVLLLFAVSNFAYSEEIYPCDSSCSGIYSEARKLAVNLPQGTTYSVIDVETWAVATYVASQRYSRPAGEYIEYPKQIATTSHAASAANQLKTAHEDVEKLVIPIPSSVAANAHSVVTSSQSENHVADHIAANLTLIDKLGGLGGLLLEIFDKIVDINTVLEVEFADGSTAKFVLTGLTGPGIEFEFEFLSGSAVDSDGNNIPDSPDDVPGTRSFSNEANQDLFRGVGELYGVEFNYGGCRSMNATICAISSNGYSCTTFTVCF